MLGTNNPPPLPPQGDQTSPHMHWLSHCVMQWYQRESNQKLPDLCINHYRANRCLFCMDCWYLLWNQSHFSLLSCWFSIRQSQSDPNAVRMRLSMWEDVCLISNFFPHMYDMWKMSHSLRVCKKPVWFKHVCIFFVHAFSQPPGAVPLWFLVGLHRCSHSERHVHFSVDSCLHD